jgi:hypothetical protein
MQVAALRSHPEKQPTDLQRSPRDLGDGALRSGRCLLARAGTGRSLSYVAKHDKFPLQSGSGPNRTKVVNRDNLNL